MGGRKHGGSGRRTRAGGFTFVEILAALLFLALVVPAIVTALTLSNKASEFTERGGAAGALAENKLNEMLTADAWQAAGSAASGDCGPDWPGYRWEMTQSPWSGGGTVGGSSGVGGTSPSPAAASPGTGSTSTGNTGSTGTTTLTELKVTVFFKVQGVERNVALTTVINSLASASTTTSTSGGTP